MQWIMHGEQNTWYFVKSRKMISQIHVHSLKLSYIYLIKDWISKFSQKPGFSQMPYVSEFSGKRVNQEKHIPLWLTTITLLSVLFFGKRLSLGLYMCLWEHIPSNRAQQALLVSTHQYGAPSLVPEWTQQVIVDQEIGQDSHRWYLYHHGHVVAGL